MQSSNRSEAFFTIYQSKQAIEIRLGCEDQPNARIISTSKSYASAYQVAQVAASSKQMPLENYVPEDYMVDYSF